jgi:hypothetical protein
MSLPISAFQVAGISGIRQYAQSPITECHCYGDLFQMKSIHRYLGLRVQHFSGDPVQPVTVLWIRHISKIKKKQIYYKFITSLISEERYRF